MSEESRRRWAIIFVGPSLPRDLRPASRCIEYRPPVRRGDVASILDTRPLPTAIAIIDGEFHQSLSVSPREVLAGAQAGIHVYGASSMGALRAAELCSFGVTGVGRIFEMYRDGEVSSDDEVALLFDPDLERAVSEPLVNIRCSVGSLLARGDIDDRCANAIIDVAQSLPYADRRYPTIVRLVSKKLDRSFEHLTRLLGAHDQKRLDAMATCRRVREMLGEPE